MAQLGNRGNAMIKMQKYCWEQVEFNWRAARKRKREYTHGPFRIERQGQHWHTNWREDCFAQKMRYRLLQQIKDYTAHASPPMYIHWAQTPATSSSHARSKQPNKSASMNAKKKLESKVASTAQARTHIFFHQVSQRTCELLAVDERF
jgi:hypothetical protein